MAAKDSDSGSAATPSSVTPNTHSSTIEPDTDSTTVEPDMDMATVVPDTGESGEGGKLKMIVQLLKRCLGVKDLAAMYVYNRLSISLTLINGICSFS